MDIIQPLKIIWYKNTCPHCHQETGFRPMDWTLDDGSEFTSDPHKNPFDCIVYLRSIIADLVDDVRALQYPDDD